MLKKSRSSDLNKSVEILGFELEADNAANNRHSPPSTTDATPIPKKTKSIELSLPVMAIKKSLDNILGTQLAEPDLQLQLSVEKNPHKEFNSTMNRLNKSITAILFTLWCLVALFIILDWQFNDIISIPELETYRKYKATGDGCVTLGIWYEIVIAMPLVSFPGLLYSIYQYDSYKYAIPLCLGLIWGDSWHTKLHITGFEIDVLLTLLGQLMAFSWFLYIYLPRPIAIKSLSIKLFIFAIIEGILYFTLGVPMYFSFALTVLLVCAVGSNRLHWHLGLACIICCTSINVCVYFEAVHCHDVDRLLNVDAHLFTDLTAQCIMALGILVAWQRSVHLVDMKKNKHDVIDGTDGIDGQIS